MSESVSRGTAPTAAEPYDDVVFLGDDLLPWMVVALGGALFVGNVLAIVKPPAHVQEGRLERAPIGRSLVMAGIGLVALIWGAGSLIAG